jgi:hypothetical protein
MGLANRVKVTEQQLIRVIKEQVEKNKLRPIKSKPELPPTSSWDPEDLTAWKRVGIEICNCTGPSCPSYATPGNLVYWNTDPTLHCLGDDYQNGALGTGTDQCQGFQCNGQLCDANTPPWSGGDLGSIFSHELTGLPGTIVTYELKELKYPIVGHNPKQMITDTCDGCTDSTASNFNSMATTDDGSCEYCDVFNSWPVTSTQGCDDFNSQHGATIAGGTPVNSQWIYGGCSTYYPTQNTFCEICNNYPVGHSIWTDQDTSPIGTNNWLIDPAACSCCGS